MNKILDLTPSYTRYTGNSCYHETVSWQDLLANNFTHVRLHDEVLSIGKFGPEEKVELESLGSYELWSETESGVYKAWCAGCSPDNCMGCGVPANAEKLSCVADLS